MTEHRLTWRASPAALALTTCAAVALTAGVVGAVVGTDRVRRPDAGSARHGDVVAPVRRDRHPRRGVGTHAAMFRIRVRALLGGRDGLRWCGGTRGGTGAVRRLHGRAGRRRRLRGIGGAVGPYGVTDGHGTCRRRPAHPVAFSGSRHGTAGVPVGAAHADSVAHATLPDPIGAHRTRRFGSGVEFGDIRPHAPGDPLRSVNWPVSARRGRLHVTNLSTDRAADVVAVPDPTPQAPGPASESLHRTVRGATQVVQTARSAATAPGSSPMGSGCDGSAPTSDAGSSTESSTPSSTPTTAPPKAHSSPGSRCRRGRWSSRSPPCWTPTSRCRCRS